MRLRSIRVPSRARRGGWRPRGAAGGRRRWLGRPAERRRRGGGAATWVQRRRGRRGGGAEGAPPRAAVARRGARRDGLLGSGHDGMAEGAAEGRRGPPDCRSIPGGWRRRRWPGAARWAPIFNLHPRDGRQTSEGTPRIPRVAGGGGGGGRWGRWAVSPTSSDRRSGGRGRRRRGAGAPWRRPDGRARRRPRPVGMGGARGSRLRGPALRGRTFTTAGLRGPWTPISTPSPASCGSGCWPRPGRRRRAAQERIRALVEREAGVLDARRASGLAERIAERAFGLGPLEPLLADPAVEEVMVSGTAPVWVERGGGWSARRCASSARRTCARRSSGSSRRSGGGWTRRSRCATRGCRTARA